MLKRVLSKASLGPAERLKRKDDISPDRKGSSATPPVGDLCTYSAVLHSKLPWIVFG